MAATTAQPPLPMLPGDAVPVGPAAGLAEGDVGGVVFVHGSAAFSWDAGDEAGRRLAAVQLVRLKTAKAREVAAAFDVGSATLWRWDKTYTKHGVAGLVTARRGPKGPSKLTAELVARIRELDKQEHSLSQIAKATGVSTFAVRTALGRVGQPAPPQTQAQKTQAQKTQAQKTQAREAQAEAEAEAEALPVVPDPAPRTEERALARTGMLTEAAPVFTEGARLPLAGMLLVLPALAATGLLEAAEEVYGRLRNGFYGLRASVLTLVFLALARDPRAEGLTRVHPADLGRILGLDRAPEVKTIRRKLAELAGRGKGAQLVEALARRHAAARPEALGYLYVDGHVRVYTGTRSLPKAHVTRMRIAAPATEETWVADADGDPVFVLTALPSASLASELRRLLPELRALVGDRRVTVVFDRGGYSPELFAEILAAGFDLITYRKGRWRKPAASAFSTRAYTAPDGTSHEYALADHRVRLRLPADYARKTGRKTITLRQVVRRSDNGHQTPILATREDLPAAQVAYRMGNRWRQENYFKYGRAHFALDALDGYTPASDDPDRSVPNPAKTAARKKTAAARAALQAAEARHSQAVEEAGRQLRATGEPQTVDPAFDQAVRAARAALAEAKQRAKAIPARLPLAQVNPDAQLLDPETKLITHAVRMAVYNAESALARLLAPHYARADDEGRALLREAFKLTGDIQRAGDALHVRLDPATAPRRTRALAALCAELTAAEATYPGTNLKIVYTIKGHPHTP